MKSPEALRDLLGDLSAHEYSTEVEFLASCLPLFADGLGYAGRDLRFDYSLGDAGNRLRADGVLMKDGAPQVIIEAWLERDHGRRTRSAKTEQLRHYMQAAGVNTGLLLSQRRLIVCTHDGAEREYLLGEITRDAAAEVLQTVGAAKPRHFASPDSPIIALVEATVKATTNDEKKETLETLAGFIIAETESLSVKFTNLRTRSSEIDLVCECLECTPRTPLHAYGRYFLVECKNWRKPVGAAVLRDFIVKLQKTRCSLGILFSREGVTGEASGADAMREIHSVFDRDHISVLVVSLRDLEGLRAGHELIQVLDEKLDALRFDF